MRRPPSPPAQDYVEIQNLYAYYNLTSDSGDAEGYASCWTEDGKLIIAKLNFEMAGRNNLRAFKKGDKAGRDGRYRRHWNAAIFLEWVDDQTVHGRCYLHGLNGSPGSLPELADAGVYEDIIRKEDGQWRFSRRSIAMDASQWQPPS